jgi:polynucleotide 5'-hydroxyl-kinase GRC3/NOL9
LNALNGSVIGLVIDQQTYFSKGDGSFGFIPSFTPTKGNCVGLGLVRAIDLDNQCFYILTPVEFKVLKKVNLFLRGPLELPVALMTHGYDRSHVPFTTFVGAEGVGSVAHKNRHLGRKKNQ